MDLTPEKRKWWTVAAMSFPLFILTLDFFGVTVALPDIGEDLNTSTSTLEWTVNAYLLALAAPLIAIGRLADIVGRRLIVILGIAIFFLASIACGFAQDAGFLIGARAVQGLGAAMLYSTSLSIVSNAFPVDQRGTGIGIWTAVGTIGSAMGPLIGGVLTSLLSWRWFFFVNAPIAIAGIILTLIVVEESKDESANKVDWAGFAAITVALVLITFGFQEGSDVSWSEPTVLVPLVLGLLVGVAFVVIETRVHEPLIEFAIFKTRAYFAAASVAFTGNYVFSAAMFFLTLYVQNILDLSAIAAGVVFLSFSVPFAAMSVFAGRVIARFGTIGPMVLGMLIVAAGFAILLFADTETGVIVVVAGMIVQAVGQGFAYNISTTAGMNAVSEQKAGLASGAISAIRMTALVFGVAITGIVFKTFETRAVRTETTDVGGNLAVKESSEIRELLSGSDAARERLREMSRGVAAEVDGIVDRSFEAGLRMAMLSCLVVSLLGAAAALAGRAPRKKHTHVPSSHHAIPIAEPADLEPTAAPT